jgi:hypothetical protein
MLTYANLYGVASKIPFTAELWTSQRRNSTYKIYMGIQMTIEDVTGVTVGSQWSKAQAIYSASWFTVAVFSLCAAQGSGYTSEKEWIFLFLAGKSEQLCLNKLNMEKNWRDTVMQIHWVRYIQLI